jgi:hypothetical protein
MGMKVQRKSAITGIWRTREINIKQKDYEAWEKGYVSVHDAMPYLNEDERTFLLAGITDQEWRAAFSAEVRNIINDTI